jgi:hypothetical protein
LREDIPQGGGATQAKTQPQRFEQKWQLEPKWLRIILAHSRNSNSYLTLVLVEAPTPQAVGYFHVTLRNITATALQDEQFHFSVLA